MKINLLVILFALIMTSCKVTEEKARSWVYANKDVLAMWCDDCFFDKKEFVYVEGKTVTLTDTVLDSVPYPVMVDCPDGTVIVTDCPPVKIVTVNKARTDTIYQDRPATLAKLKVLSDNLYASQFDLAVMTYSRDGWKKWCLIFGGAMLLSIVVFVGAKFL